MLEHLKVENYRLYSSTDVLPGIDFLCDRAIASGELISMLEEFLDWSGPLQLLWPADRHSAPRVRAFVDYVSSRLFKTAQS